MSTANLKYLSSSQMLEDVGTFIPAMITQFNLAGAKWIAFGGSYSGSTSNNLPSANIPPYLMRSLSNTKN